jgi:hypothetical protein
VVIIDLMQETMASSIISRPSDVAMELNAIAEICKYKGLHERDHFIPMAMEVHNAPEHDMDHFIRECACLFHKKRLKGYLFLSFCIQFCR